MLEDKLQEKSRIHKEQVYFSVLSSSYGKPYNFHEAWHHKYPEERKVRSTSIQKEFQVHDK